MLTGARSPIRPRAARLAHSTRIALGALALALAVALGGLASSASARALRPRRPALEHHSLRSSDAPLEGIFDGCDLGSELSICEQRLAVIAHGGLKVVVIGVGQSSVADLAAYAGYAQSLGMRVMWELNDPGYWGGVWNGSSAAADNPQFAAACGCSDTTGVFDAMITSLASLPATYGYYAADDESIEPGQSVALRAYVSEIKALAPGQMVMIGDNIAQGQANASAGAVMGNQIYPEMTSNIANMDGNLAAWDMVRGQISQAQQTATRDGQDSAFLLQAFTFGDNLDDGEAVGACTPQMSQQQCYSRLRYPSEQVQLELRNEVLERTRAKLILWYSFQGTYGQAGDDSYSIYPTGAVAQARWAGLVQAVNAPLPAPYASAASAALKRRRAQSGPARRGGLTRQLRPVQKPGARHTGRGAGGGPDRSAHLGPFWHHLREGSERGAPAGRPAEHGMRGHGRARRSIHQHGALH